MGLTERHWFENEEPELTEHQLEDIVYENKKAYDNGYVKGFHDAKTMVTAEEFKDKMKMISERDDEEVRHIEADDLMCDFLEKLGYGEGVKIFKEMRKWYA